MDTARDYYERVIALASRSIGNAVPATNAISHYCTMLHTCNNVAESVTIPKHFLEHTEKLLGSENHEVIAVQGNLAAAHTKQEKLKEAEALARRVLDFRRRTLGDKHPETLAALSYLATTLECGRRWAEAAAVYNEEFQIEGSIYDAPDTARLALISTVGRCLTLSGHHEEAVGFWDRLLNLV
jgi:tetratricopeptide (TPR) repeat protein